MFKYEEKTIYVTRGDVGSFEVTADFKAGDIVRFKVTAKKDCEKVVCQRDFEVSEDTSSIEIALDDEATRLGDVISKPTDYWYEVELNPDTNPQTIIGYDEDGAKILRLFPEGADVNGEDIEVVGKKTLQELVEYALHEAKESGEFDGPRGIQGEKGDKGDKGDPGEDYVLTDGDKNEIASVVFEQYEKTIYATDADIIEQAMVSAEAANYGKVMNHGSCACTTYIPLEFDAGKPITVRSVFIGNIGVGFYDENHNTLLAISANDNKGYEIVPQVYLQTVTLIPPEGAKYVRLSSFVTGDYAKPSDLWVKGMAFQKGEDVLALEDKTHALEAGVDAVNREIGYTFETKTVYATADDIEEGYVSAQPGYYGGLVNISGYVRTKPMLLEFDANTPVTVRSTINGDIGFAFYDESMTALLAVSANYPNGYNVDNISQLQTLTVILPEGARYVRLCAFVGAGGKVNYTKPSDLWISGVCGDSHVRKLVRLAGDTSFSLDNFDGTDTEKLQACFDALADIGGVITINRALTLTGNVCIRNNSNLNNQIVVQASGKHAVIDMGEYHFFGAAEGAGLVSFDNISFKGTKNCVDATSLIRLRFDGCIFSGFEHIVYTDSYIQSVNITNSYVRRVSGYVYHSMSEEGSGFLYDCHFSHNVVEQSNGVLSCLNASGCSFTDSCIEGNTMGDDDLFHVYYHWFGVEISNNYFETNNGAVIDFSKSYDYTQIRLTICNNHFHETRADKAMIIMPLAYDMGNSNIIIFGNEMNTNSPAVFIKSERTEPALSIVYFANYGTIIDENNTIDHMTATEVGKMIKRYKTMYHGGRHTFRGVAVVDTDNRKYLWITVHTPFNLTDSRITQVQLWEPSVQTPSSVKVATVESHSFLVEVIFPEEITERDAYMCHLDYYVSHDD